MSDAGGKGVKPEQGPNGYKISLKSKLVVPPSEQEAVTLCLWWNWLCSTAAETHKLGFKGSVACFVVRYHKVKGLIKGLIKSIP